MPCNKGFIEFLVFFKLYYQKYCVTPSYKNHILNYMMKELKNMTLLEVSNLSFSYHSLKGEIQTLKNISFTVEEGEFVTIVGPSGCGKSTILSLIAGLLIPEAGTLTLAPSTKIGYMLQRDLLMEWKTIRENCELGLKMTGTLNEATKSYVDDLLKEYELSAFANKRPSELSGGMRQRAALIRTIAMNPDLLLLDESFSALDSQTRTLVSSDICNIIKANHKTAILVTHDPAEAVTLADRILVLTKRPASIQTIFSIQYPISRDNPILLRDTKEFQTYHKKLWEQLY